jgi:hypothetical protein
MQGGSVLYLKLFLTCLSKKCAAATGKATRLTSATNAATAAKIINALYQLIKRPPFLPT